jgi:predicted phage terminase large subunit-like protein
MAGTMGGAITGLDAGNPNVEGFGGALIIDDPVDAGNIKYIRTREECIDYYITKLETRRRTINTPTILIMQRLHKEDLSGYVKSIDSENWDFVTVKALNDNNESFWQERYPVKDLVKMQEVNAYKFYSQYQQKPTTAGGQVIKGEWFKYYPNINQIKFKRLFMTGDTAQKVQEHNDYTVFMAWGVDNANLYLLDLVRGKWEAPELLEKSKFFWSKWKAGLNGKLFSAMYIEDKASGTGLIQTLRKETKIPIIALQREKDKLTRIEDVLPVLESGRVYLPINNLHGFNSIIIEECESFARDMTHKHDDIVDNISDACNIFNQGYTIGDIL